jgi:hypothetical protein
MIWFYPLTEPSGNRLALFIAGLRVIGIFGFVLLGGYFIIQDAYLETALSVLTMLAWIAATTAAMDFVLERYSPVRLSDPNPPRPPAAPQEPPGS